MNSEVIKNFKMINVEYVEGKGEVHQFKCKRCLQEVLKLKPCKFQELIIQSNQVEDFLSYHLMECPSYEKWSG